MHTHVRLGVGPEARRGRPAAAEEAQRLSLELSRDERA